VDHPAKGSGVRSFKWMNRLFNAITVKKTEIIANEEASQGQAFKAWPFTF